MINFCDTLKPVKKYAFPLTGAVLIMIASVFAWVTCQPFMKSGQTAFLIGMFLAGPFLEILLALPACSCDQNSLGPMREGWGANLRR